MELALLAIGAVDAEAIAGALRTALAGAGLRDPEVAVRVVPALERHPETGKVRRFLPR